MAGYTVDVDLFAGLLFPRYPLDPGSIEFLIEEVTSVSPDGAVQLVCRLLAREDLDDIDRDNLSHFVRRASSAIPIRRAFERSVKRLGRCPQRERTWLRRQLQPIESEPEEPSAVLTPLDTATLDLRGIAGSFAQFPIVIDRIGSLPPNVERLSINLNEFTYAAVLAVVAQWILARQLVNQYTIACPPLMDQYLENIRFAAALRNPEIVISPDPMDWAVGLTRINRDQPTEKVTEKIVEILDTFITPAKAEREALFVLVSEMIENVHRHAQSLVDGIAVAQVYPSQLKMGITLVDAGIGVRESFKSGEPSIPINTLRTDEDFLRQAVKLHATSKVSQHSGYGLFLLSELIARNRGTFLLTSGTATLVGYQRRKELNLDAFHHEAWRGTIISVIIDLKQSLPLLDIYRELPTPTGYEDDDLFLR